jgi:phosphonate transport system permease protein
MGFSILERNVRSAAVVGVVGAGGIGFELMARFKNREYDMVAIILLMTFLTVFAVEHVTQWIRRKLI